MRITTSLSMLAVLGLIACNKPAEKPAESAEAKKTETSLPAVKIETATLSLPTAKCENCENTITNAVKGVDGVTDVKVDAKAHSAQVQYIATKATVGSIESAISKAGYTANKVERDPKAYEKLDECCK